MTLAAFLTPALTKTALPRKAVSATTQPTCRLSKELASAAAAAVTLSLSTLPLHPEACDAMARHCHARAEHTLVLNSEEVQKGVSRRLVVGVGKWAIHDYGPHAETGSDERRGVEEDRRGLDEDMHGVDEDARREMSFAVRLVTAVLLGVLLGAERRAETLNLGVRSMTLISLCACLTSLYVPLLVPHMAIVGSGAVVGGLVYAVARLRKRRTRFIGRMCCTIALGVVMGGACGAGLSLLSVVCYLAAVAVMRFDTVGMDKKRASNYYSGDAIRRFRPLTIHNSDTVVSP